MAPVPKSAKTITQILEIKTNKKPEELGCSSVEAVAETRNDGEDRRLRGKQVAPTELKWIPRRRVGSALKKIRLFRAGRRALERVEGMAIEAAETRSGSDVKTVCYVGTRWVDCVFAPYFPPDNPQKFTNVHKVFGASNVAKLLNELNASHREDAVNSLAYEAEYRLRDPVYGCVGLISILQHKLKQVQHDLDNAKKELATYIGPSAMLPIINHQGFLHQHPNYGASAYQVMPHNMQPMMGVPSGLPHGSLLIRACQQKMVMIWAIWSILKE
ncbi:LOB domain-containing protein 36-like [Forsythia ovata]|uniref:LOB domain-containing protein 36-like n=1 Tax=Forsythia ovata TaxID=205694 RepID=A0ABD1S6A9_9LAMI